MLRELKSGFLELAPSMKIPCAVLSDGRAIIYGEIIDRAVQACFPDLLPIRFKKLDGSFEKGYPAEYLPDLYPTFIEALAEVGRRVLQAYGEGKDLGIGELAETFHNYKPGLFQRNLNRTLKRKK